MQVVSYIEDGRMRVTVPGAKGSPRRMAEVERALRQIPGVHSAEGNATAGSVRVRFDPRALGCQDVLDALRPFAGSAAHPHPAPQAGTGRTSAHARHLRQRVASVIVTTAVEKAVAIAVERLLLAAL